MLDPEFIKLVLAVKRFEGGHGQARFAEYGTPEFNNRIDPWNGLLHGTDLMDARDKKPTRPREIEVLDLCGTPYRWAWPRPAMKDAIADFVASIAAVHAANNAHLKAGHGSLAAYCLRNLGS